MASKHDYSKKIRPKPEPLTFDVVYETVVGRVVESGGDHQSPVHAALGLIADQYAKHAEQANGTYRFAIPNVGDFCAEMQCDPFFDDSVPANRLLETQPVDTY